MKLSPEYALSMYGYEMSQNKFISANEQEATTRENADAELQDNIDTLTDTVEVNKEESENAHSTLQDNIDTLGKKVDENATAISNETNSRETADRELETKIATNSTAIEGLKSSEVAKEHFKGYYKTNAEIGQIEAQSGDFAYSAESGTKWVYYGEMWNDTKEEVPDQTVEKGTITPLMDGEANVGESNTYAAADHVHPTDTTRASQSDLNALSSNLSQEITDRQTDIQNVSKNLESVTTNLSTNLNSVATNLSTNITSVQDSLDGKIETVRKTADSAKQIADTSYENDKYTRELVDNLSATHASDMEKVNSAISTETNERKDADTALQTNIDAKANIDEVYTKSEIDEKGYLTEHQDLSEYVKMSDIDSKLVGYETVETHDFDIDSLTDVDKAATRLMSELKTRIELLEKANTTMSYASSSEDITSVLESKDTVNTDLVVTSSEALTALNSATASTIFKNIAVVGSETSETVQLNAADDLVIDNFNFSGEKGSTNGKINYSGKNVTISNVTCDKDSTVYNVFEGNQNTDNADNALLTSRTHIERLVANNIVIDNPNLAHNVCNIYTPAEGANITIKDSSFNLNPLNSNVLRMANYLNSSNIVITFQNVKWTYENVKGLTDDNFAEAGLMLYQPAGKDNALVGEDLTALNTWKVVIDNCYYNGEKVTANNFGSHNQVLYTFNVGNTKEHGDPIEKGYFTVEFK